MVEIKKNTHIVCKDDDAREYLTVTEYEILKKLLHKVKCAKFAAKGVVSEYLIVNKDEPYADKIQQDILEGEDEKWIKTHSF